METRPLHSLTPDQARARRVVSRYLDRYRTKAIHFARRYIVSWDEREDAVQDAAVKALANATKYDPKRPFETWFFCIVKNVCLDRRRAADRLPLVLSFDDEGVEDAQERSDHQYRDAEAERVAEMARTVGIERLRSAMAALPKRDRDIVNLMLMVRWPVSRVAWFARMSESDVVALRDRVIGELRQQLQRS